MLPAESTLKSTWKRNNCLMTSLEISLISLFSSMIVGIAVRLFTQARMVSRDECRQKHQYEQNQQEQIVKEMQYMRAQLQAQSRMIRALVVNSEMDSKQQQEILNENAS